MARLMKKERTLQRPMEITQPEKASSSQDATGYLPSGEIPGVSTASTTGHLPSGLIPGVHQQNALKTYHQVRYH